MDLGEGHGRDLLVAVAVVGGILLVLFLYTGNWPPPVVVESNSMMQVDPQEYEENYGTTRAEDVPYGRIGTIDPGDLVLVKEAGDASTISTYADGEEEHYGRPGEVVVYFTNGARQGTPIIHRAMTHVNVQGQGEDRTYEVRWTSEWDSSEATNCEERDSRQVCTFGSGGVTIPELNIDNREFTQDGFITKGDNVAGNRYPDQVLGIYDQPVPADQIQGVARGELPWFGLIKLTLTGNPRSTVEVQDHPYYWTIGAMTAPQDLWIMLVVGLGVVGLAPVGLDYGIHYGRRWIEEKRESQKASDGVNPNDAAANPGSGEPPDEPPSGGASDDPEAEASAQDGPDEETPPDDDDGPIKFELE